MIADCRLQATTCLANPKWSFVQLLIMVLVVVQLVGLWYSVARDRIELRFIEARGSREMQGGAARCREVQRGSGRCSEVQRGAARCSKVLRRL